MVKGHHRRQCPSPSRHTPRLSLPHPSTDYPAFSLLIPSPDRGPEPHFTHEKQ